MEDKYMEKTRFYDREKLDVEDILELIQIWEDEAGESFTDYCSFSHQSDGDFLSFLSTNYEVLYKYCIECITEEGDDWLQRTVQYVADYCVEFYIYWIPDDNCGFWNKSYELGMYPLAHFIKENDLAWQNFKDFFTSGDNTVDGTPYIDCYNIRKQFEDGRKL